MSTFDLLFPQLHATESKGNDCIIIEITHFLSSVQSCVSVWRREHIEMQKKWLIRLSHGYKNSTCDSWELSFSASVDYHQT